MLIHPQGRSEHPRPRIRNAQEFEEPLDASVIPILAVERYEGEIDLAIRRASRSRCSEISTVVFWEMSCQGTSHKRPS
jgi:hypothetical protein